MNNSLLNPELKKFLKHAEKNLIDLEDTSDCDHEHNSIELDESNHGDDDPGT